MGIRERARAAFSARSDVISPGAAIWRSRIPGALNDPLVGGLSGTREFVVTDDPSWQIDAAAEHDRTQNRHEPAPPGESRRRSCLQVARHRLPDLLEQS